MQATSNRHRPAPEERQRQQAAELAHGDQHPEQAEVVGGHAQRGRQRAAERAAGKRAAVQDRHQRREQRRLYALPAQAPFEWMTPIDKRSTQWPELAAATFRTGK